MMLIPRGNYGLNLLDDFFNDPFFTGSSEKQAPAQKMPIMRTDILEQDGNYILEIELPGYGKDEIQAELKDGYLTVTAQHGQEQKATGTYLHRERYTGACKRTFYVGEQLRQEDIRAAFANGVLRLTVPKDAPKVEAAPKYISID